MTTRYCGAGGNDANDGLSWANRKLTLNGVEDTPVASGDIVYVGPGVYRELLTVDVSGASAITYIGDVTGEHTDGVGGIVRITGSDNDQVATRNYCISATGKNYRVFTGFAFDTTVDLLITCTSDCTNWILQDCFFTGTSGVNGVTFNGNGGGHIIRRCFFLGGGLGRYSLYFTNASGVSNSGITVENCLFIGARAMGNERVGGITVSNCSFIQCSIGVRVVTALTAGQTMTVHNCIFAGSGSASVQATTTAEFMEDYNTFYGNTTDRTNVNIGAHSTTYPPLFVTPLYLSGIKFPWQFGELSQWSQIREIAGVSVPAVDLFGLLRPTLGLYGWVDASWGAIQYQDVVRATNTVRTGTASLLMADSARHQIFVPIAAESTTFSVYVYREASYIGNNPQMVIKQPGQSDRLAIDVGLAGQWNNLTITFTPAALPPYVVIELVSENQQENSIYGGNYDVYWDDLTVT